MTDKLRKKFPFKDTTLKTLSFVDPENRDMIQAESGKYPLILSYNHFVTFPVLSVNTKDHMVHEYTTDTEIQINGKEYQQIFKAYLGIKFLLEDNILDWHSCEMYCHLVTIFMR